MQSLPTSPRLFFPLHSLPSAEVLHAKSRKHDLANSLNTNRFRSTCRITYQVLQRKSVSDGLYATDIIFTGERRNLSLGARSNV